MRVALAAAVAAVVVVVAVLAVGAAAGQAHDDDDADDEKRAAATLRMLDTEFDPRRFAVEPGARIALDNGGAEPHSFTSSTDRKLFHETVLAGDEGEATAPEAEGKYPFYCVFHASAQTDPDEGMAGVLTVRVGAENEPSGERDGLPGSGAAATLVALAAAALLAATRRPLR